MNKKIEDRTEDRPKDTLYNQCTGYDYYEDVPFKLKNQELSMDGKTLITVETIKMIKIKKHRHAKTSAQKQWFNGKKNKKYFEEEE